MIYVAVALFVVLVIHTVGGGCPQDEAGYCDDDWKPPTPLQSLTNFMRISFLTFAAWRGLVTGGSETSDLRPSDDPDSHGRQSCRQ